MTLLLAATGLTVMLAIVFDFTNGFHDAANATSTVIATRSLTPRQAVIVAAVFNFLPALVVGTAVASTIARTVQLDMLPAVAAGDVPYGVRIALSALVAAVFWNYLTWWLGLPSSSSQALLGGLVGAAWSAAGAEAVNWDVVRVAAIAIVVSPVVALGLALVAMALIRAVQRVSGLSEDSEFFRWSQVASSVWVAWSHGTNDAQKTMGVIAATLYAAGYSMTVSAKDIMPPLWVVLVAHAAIALGTLWGGWRIIETLGVRITRITRASGLAANLGAIASIDGASHAGIPISTTQAVSASIVGSGLGARRHVNLGVIRDMAIAWVVTLPAAAVVAALMLRLTLLPGAWGIATTVVAVTVLLAWAARLMWRAHGATDLEKHLPASVDMVKPVDPPPARPLAEQVPERMRTAFDVREDFAGEDSRR